jgi:hypothetical protein
MDTLIDFCVEHFAGENFPADQMRSYMQTMLPTLKHWKK